MNTLTDLFVNLLKTSLSGGIIILLVLLMRLVFRQTPKALICLCWIIAILRLLIPFHIEANWSLQPSAAVLTDRMESFQISPASSGIVDDTHMQTILREPTVQASSGLDALQILGIVWTVGAAIMLAYALVSYLRLKRRVGECVKVSHGVYWCPGLDTAFLFGYIRPRIYLPETDGETAKYICLHEQAHLYRCDHWLMLAGYLALCLHWFNPLVWLSYIYLCRDIESACDERVIRTLDTEERKAYANALLSCGKHRSFPVGCPVAFGEVSIKQRIIGVLNYRKPVLWVCILLLAVIVGVGAFFLTDPVEYPPYYMVLMKSLSDPLDEVCDALGIAKEDLLDDGRGNYTTPIFVEYAGVPMRLCLHTAAGPEGEALQFFSYNAVYDGSTDEADRATAAIARRLYKTYGTGEIAKLGSNPDLFQDISAEEVTAIFRDRTNTGDAERIFDHWDITDSGHGNLDAHIESLQKEHYENNDTAGAKVCYLVRFLASYDLEQDQKTVSIAYRNYVSFTDWDFGGTFATKLNPLQ